VKDERVVVKMSDFKFWHELEKRMKSTSKACLVFQECEKHLDDSLKRDLETIKYANNEFLHLDIGYKRKLLDELKKISEICMSYGEDEEALCEKRWNEEMVRYETLK